MTKITKEAADAIAEAYRNSSKPSYDIEELVDDHIKKYPNIMEYLYRAENLEVNKETTKEFKEFKDEYFGRVKPNES